MKHDLDYMIAVMQAAKEGKEIEYSQIVSMFENWIPVENPLWDWASYHYRIKPEEPKPEYVPYETGAEFIQEVLKHKGWVMIPDRDGKEEGDCYYPIGSFGTFDGTCVVMSEELPSISFEDLLRVYVWADDKTPCGKLKQ